MITRHATSPCARGATRFDAAGPSCALDITMRARSYKSLVEAGMSADHAARLCGLEPEPVTAMPDGMDAALV